MAACRRRVSTPWRKKPSIIQEFRYSSALVNREIPAAKQKYVPTSGTYPQGFLVSGVHVGVKPSNTSLPDLAIIASEKECTAAAVFTQNIFQAAPVTYSRETLIQNLAQGFRAIVINSGCANAVTGRDGREDAASMGSVTDKAVKKRFHIKGRDRRRSLVMSTGVIGQRLPIEKITRGIPHAFKKLGNDHQSWLTAAGAICTTDTFPKLLSMTFTLPSSPSITYRLAGMTKGAGMIHPDMATLLGVICTDAPIRDRALQSLLVNAVTGSFNAISVDGDTSTNDTVAILANGAAGGPEISSKVGQRGREMQKVLTSFAQKLSELVVRDGEGATKFVHIRVINAPTSHDAKLIASTIARSPLVKTALYGCDANWGRIICAIGYTKGFLDRRPVMPERTSVSFVPQDGSDPLNLLVNGEPRPLDEARAAQILANEDLEILIDLGEDKGRYHQASYWTCDFSHEYVTINGDYRT